MESFVLLLCIALYFVISRHCDNKLRLGQAYNINAQTRFGVGGGSTLIFVCVPGIRFSNVFFTKSYLECPTISTLLAENDIHEYIISHSSY